MAQQEQQQFIESLEAAHFWIQDVKERVRVNDNTQGPRDALKIRLDETKQIYQSKHEGLMKMEDVQMAAQNLLKREDEELHRSINATLKELKDMWDETEQSITHCHSRIEWVWLRWSEYLKAYEEFEFWLKKQHCSLAVEQQLGAKEKLWQTDQQRVVVSDVHGKEPLLERLLEEAAVLHSTTQDPSLDSQTQERLRVAYNDLRNRNEERLALLQRISDEHYMYQDYIDKFQAFLSAKTIELNQLMEQEEPTEGKLKTLKALDESVACEEKTLKYIEVIADDVKANTSPAGAETVQEEAEELRLGWQRLRQGLFEAGEALGCSLDPHSLDSHSPDSHSVDSHSVDSHSPDSHSVDSHSVDSHSVDSHSVDSHSVDSHSVDSHSVDSHSVDSHRVDSHSQGSHSQGSHSQGSHSQGSHSQGSHSQGSHSQGSHCMDPHIMDFHSVDSHSQGSHSHGSHSMDFHSVDSHSQSSQRLDSRSQGSQSQGSQSVDSHSQCSQSVDFHSQGSHSQGSQSVDSHIQGSHSQGSHIQGSHIQGSHIQGSHSQGSHSQGSHSQGSHSQGSHSQGSQSVDSHIQGSHIQGSQSVDSHIQGSHIQGSQSVDSHIQGSHIQGSHIQGSHIQGSHSQGSHSQSSQRLDSHSQGSHSADFHSAESQSEYVRRSQRLQQDIGRLRELVEGLDTELDHPQCYSYNIEEQIVGRWKEFTDARNKLEEQESQVDDFKARLTELFKFSVDSRFLSDEVQAVDNELQSLKSRATRLCSESKLRARSLLQEPLQEYADWSREASEVLETSAGINDFSQISEPVATIERLLKDSFNLQDRLSRLEQKGSLLESLFEPEKASDMLVELSDAIRQQESLQSQMVQQKERMQGLILETKDFDVAYKQLDAKMSGFRKRLQAADVPQTDIFAIDSQLEEMCVLRREVDDFLAYLTALTTLASSSEEDQNQLDKLVDDWHELQRLVEEKRREKSHAISNHKDYLLIKMRGLDFPGYNKKTSSWSSKTRSFLKPRLLGRVCRMALPLWLLLLALLFLASFLLPFVDESNSCSFTNNFARSFNIMLRYHGPPPT